MPSEEELKAKERAAKQADERDQRYDARIQTKVDLPIDQSTASSSFPTSNPTSHIVFQSTTLSSSTRESVEIPDSTIGNSISSHTLFEQPNLQLTMEAQYKAVIDSIPTFSGDTNEKVNDWLDIVGLKFDILSYTLEQRRRFIPQYLTGEALKWHLTHRQDFPDWITYIDGIKAAFPQILTNSRDMNLQLLRDRKQGPKEPFTEYYASILQLCRQHNPDVTNTQIIDWLKGGMQLKLYERLQGAEFDTPQKLLTHVQRLEQDNAVIEARKRDFASKSNRPSFPYNTSTYYESQATTMPTPSYPPPLMPTPYPYTQFPLTSTPQPSSPHSTSFPRRHIVCYNCGQPGHISPQCPSRPNY